MGEVLGPKTLKNLFLQLNTILGQSLKNYASVPMCQLCHLTAHNFPGFHPNDACWLEGQLTMTHFFASGFR